MNVCLVLSTAFGMDRPYVLMVSPNKLLEMYVRLMNGRIWQVRLFPPRTLGIYRQQDSDLSLIDKLRSK